MKKFYLFVLLLVFAVPGNAQMWQWQWAKKYTNVPNPVPERMVRHMDHLIMSGHYTNASGDPGIFIMMLDTTGNMMWTQTFDRDDNSSFGGIQINAPALVVDNNGIYVGGSFTPGTLTVDTNVLVNTASYNGYAIKLDMSGNVVWARQYGGNDNDWVADLVIHNGQLWMLASYEGTATFGSQTVVATGGLNNMLIAELAPGSGDLLGYISHDVDLKSAGRLRFTSNNEYVIMGLYGDHVNANSAQIASNPSPNNRRFLLLLNNAGVGQWAQPLTFFGLGPISGVEDMELDGMDSIYVDNNGSGVGYAESFLEKYTFNSSTPTWVREWNATDYDNRNLIGDIEISGTNVYVLAMKHDAVSPGLPDDDIVKLGVFNYTTSGALLWADTSVWNNRSMTPAGLVQGIGNNLYTLSSFSDTIMVDTTTLISTGADAILVAKIGEPTVTGIPGIARTHELGIYPNPSTGSFTLQASAEGEMQLRIRNMQGQVVYASQLSIPTGGLNTTVHANELANGIYSIELVNGENIARQKLVIANK